MKSSPAWPKWIPQPAAWASAVTLFVFALAIAFAFGAVLPVLFDLMRHSPRLGWLGVLLVWLSPIPIAAAGHHAMHAVIDLGDSKKVARGPLPRSASLWAGFVAWATILVVSLTTNLILLILDPPPVEPDVLKSLAAGLSPGAVVPSLVWIVLAASVYALEHAAAETLV